MVPQKLGFSAQIVVPTNTPKIKVDGIKQYGADLLLFGELTLRLKRKLKKLQHKQGASTFPLTMTS